MRAEGRTDGRTDRQTDRQTDREAERQMEGRTNMTKLRVACRNFANAPKNCSEYFLHLVSNHVVSRKMIKRQQTCCA